MRSVCHGEAIRRCDCCVEKREIPAVGFEEDSVDVGVMVAMGLQETREIRLLGGEDVTFQERLELVPCSLLHGEKFSLQSKRRTWTSTPYPPSSPPRDQHAVVRSHDTPCVCAPCWAYAVRVGIEPTSAALALPRRHCPAVGLCSLLVAATTNSSYSTNVASQSASCIFVSSSRYSLARSSAFL
jgi:hypothetical protein